MGMGVYIYIFQCTYICVYTSRGYKVHIFCPSIERASSLTEDKVRHCKPKNIFSKSDEVLWTDTIYTVTDIIKNKLYISNHEQQLNRYFKPYELSKITDVVGEYDKPEITHEIIHTALKKSKKIDKDLKLVGIDKNNDLGDSKRIKKPTYKMMK